MRLTQRIDGVEVIPSAALVGEKAVIGQGAEDAATAVARPPAIAGNRYLLISSPRCGQGVRSRSEKLAR